MAAASPVLARDEAGTLERVLQVLGSDGVVVLPTETLYGFSCLGSSPSAIERIQHAKGIEQRRGFVALVDSLETLEPYLAAEQELHSLAFLRRVWPAPLTAVLNLKAPVPWGERVHSVETAAFRVPQHRWLLKVLERLGEPLISTSVNRSGHAPLLEIEGIEREFGDVVDLIVSEPPADRTCGRRDLPSTVVDCTAWPPRLLRAGRFDLEGEMRRGGM